MTAIVAIYDRGHCFFGADSAVTVCGGEGRRIDREPKIWRAGNAVLGAAGDGEWCRSLRRLEWPPELTAAWIADELPRLKIRGSGQLLVGLPSGLLELDEGFDPFSPALPFAAIGSGAQPAIGALWASRRLPPKRRLAIALEAAERFTNTVSRPFRYIV